MARVSYLVLVFLALATSVRSQFFADIFQGFQPFVTTRPTNKLVYDQTTRAKTYQNRGIYRQTTKAETTTKAYENEGLIYPPIVENESDRRKTTVNYVYTTMKPNKIKESSRRINGNKRDQATQSDFNRLNYDGKINFISYTEKPYSNTEFNRNYYTTHNPLFNRPGVKPAVVDNRPPITNRPVTKRPNYGSNPRPKDQDAIDFPGDDTGPEIIIGPDEDYMSSVEKKRYLELAERMCDKYKSVTTIAVQAIPLLPSPEPVSLNVTQCTPTTVPLVVGGRAVRVEEFPHMALLGWRKLQGPGYSWKCGGSLVSDQFILTAAHCTYQDRDNTVVTGPPTAVQLGSSYLDDPGALVVKVAAVIRHPKYKQPRSYYDLAIVKMVNAVKFSEMIKPACLGEPPAVGKSIIATGWGRTEFGGDQSHELRSVSLPVWGMPRCREVLGTSRKLPEGPSADSQVCAGEERGGKDTCQGDSGGPAQVQESCIWRVVAVTSLGRSCGAAETPGLYARVHRAFVASQVFGKSWNEDSGDGNGNSGGNRDKHGSGGSYDDNGSSQNSGSNRDKYGYSNGDSFDNAESNNRDKYGNSNGSNENNGQNSQRKESTNRDRYGNSNGGSYDNNGQNSQNSGSTNRDKYGNSNGGYDSNNYRDSNRDGYGGNNGNSANNRDRHENNGGTYGNDGESSQNYGGVNRDRYGNNNGQNSQNYGNANRDKYGSDNNRDNYGYNNNNRENYGSNNRENGNNNAQNYGSSNIQNGNKNRQSYGSQFSNSGQSYDANNENNRQKPTTERPSFNREQYTTENGNYNDNYGSASNSGNNNRPQTNYNQGSQISYTTQRPRFNTTTRNSNNYYNDFTTTRRTTGNGNRGSYSNTSNNYYNTQNFDSNNRRPSETYTISRPWWL